jgi:hypothetical protein
VAALMNAVAAIMALAVLKPLRSRQLTAPAPEFTAIHRPT